MSPQCSDCNRNTACVEGAVIVGAKRSADLKSLVSCKIKLGLACESIMQRGTNTRITWLNDRNDLVTNANHSVFTQKIELRFSAHEDRRFSARLLGYSSTDDEDEAPLEYYSSAYGLDGSGTESISYEGTIANSLQGCEQSAISASISDRSGLTNS
jgi:hypothetical protein